MKTMKKAKAPSAKTLARKAKEAAMIAWAKQQQAQFRADLREMFAKEKFENGMNGFTTLASFAIPTKIPTLRGTKPEMNFQEFSKAMKGSYKGQECPCLLRKNKP